MRFERIRLANYRGIRSLEFRPRPAGVTVIEGENEAGKSSIAEALWLVFEAHDDSSSKLVNSLQPKGHDAATEIEVEVTTGAYRFVYTKRFHRSPRTELRVEAPKREQLTGREADTRALQILDETIDRQLWRALGAQQGKALDPLDVGNHSALTRALEFAAGQVVGGDREASLYSRAEAEYQRYFTLTGREKSGGNVDSLPTLRTDRDRANTEVTRLSTRIESLEERAGQAAGLEREVAETTALLEAARNELERLSTIEVARQEQQLSVTRLADHRKLQGLALAATRDRRDTRRKQIAALGALQESLEDAGARVAALGPPIEHATTAKQSASEELERAGQAASAAASARVRAESLGNFAEKDLQAEQMAERLQRLERNEPERDRLAAWLAACTIDRAVIAKLESAVSNLETGRARKEAEGAQVEISAANGLDFRIGDRPVRIEPGATRRGPILGESVMTFPGGVTIKVRAGARAREAQADFAAASATLEQLLASAGVESVAAARGVFEERVKKEERLAGLESQIRSDIRDLKSSGELREKLEREQERLAAMRHDLEVGDRQLTTGEAKDVLDAARSEAAALENSVELARTALNTATAALASLERDRDQLAERIRTLNEDAARRDTDLAGARAEEADDTLEENVRRLEAEYAASQMALDEATRLLAEIPDESAALAGQTARVRQLEAQLNSASLEIARLKGVLEDAGAEGLLARLQEAEQQLDAAEATLQAFEQRAGAARLLFETLRRHHDLARGSYVRPLRDRINELGRLMFGESFSVELSDDLQVVRRSLHGTDLPIEQLSVGSREQLAVVTRLACASLVSASGGAPLVLDDILGWSDPQRLAKFATLLPGAAAGVQVLLFTCTPERFAGVVPARVVSLPGGQTTERTAAAPGATPAPAARASQAPARRPADPDPVQPTFDLFESPPNAVQGRN